MKYLGIILPRNVQNLCKGNIKTLLKDTNVDLNIDRLDRKIQNNKDGDSP